MGLSQAWILKTFSKPHKWAQKIKHDSANPGVNAWASGKGRTIVFDINQPTREFLIDALDFQQPARVQPSSGHTESRAKL